jgi:prolyl 4-hydroxylase
LKLFTFACCEHAPPAPHRPAQRPDLPGPALSPSACRHENPENMTRLQKTALLDDAIFTVSDFLSPLECSAWIRRAEDLGLDAAPITTAFGFAMVRSVRNNTRVMFDDETSAAELWSRLAPFVPPTLDGARAIGLNERFRVYRYERAQYFRWHSDGAFVRNAHERSELTLMIYLNGDFEGGTTDFDTRRAALRVEPVAGTALVFEHPLRHQGAPVARGRKYVLRTDVMYRVA